MGSMLDELLKAALSDKDREAFEKITGIRVGNQPTQRSAPPQGTGFFGPDGRPVAGPRPDMQPRQQPMRPAGQAGPQGQTPQNWQNGQQQGWQSGPRQGMPSGQRPAQGGSTGVWPPVDPYADFDPEGQTAEGAPDDSDMEGRSLEGANGQTDPYAPATMSPPAGASIGTVNAASGGLAPGGRLRTAAPEAEEQAPAAGPILKMDSDSLLQGLLWSEILDRPKALRRR